MLNMNKLMKLVVAGLVIFPSVAFAQGRITYLVSDVRQIIDTLIIIVAGIALLVFFWGLAKFILKVGGDEEAVKEGKTLMIWGVVALFVMVSVWGIIRVIQGELLPGTNFDTAPRIPTFRQ